MSAKRATPEQVNAIYVGCASFENLAEEVADLRIENTKLRKAGKDLLAACPHEGEGVKRARAAMKMREAIES